MQSPQSAPRRSNTGFIGRQRANRAIKPFVASLGTWNAKAAHLKVRASSPYSSEEERTLARLEGGALLAEIRHRQGDYLSAIKGEPPHDRLTDVAAAFERLVDQLEQVSRIPRARD